MRLRINGLLSLLAVVLLSVAGIAAAVAADGPYVRPDAKGELAAQWITDGDAGPKVERKTTAVGRAVTIPVVGRLPAFEVHLREPAKMAPNEIAVPADTPLFFIADTHGEYEILAELLQAQRIVDRKLRWAFGRSHVVFLGDVLDRGPHQTEILWLIYQLEGEAAKAGGGVHLLLGNHEAMVLHGDARYLNPKYIQTTELLGVDAYSELFGPRTVLGQWLRSKPAVLKLNDLLLLHGGISPEVVDRGLTLAQLNAAVRDTLNDDLQTPEAQTRSEFVMGPSGPLWYRGYFAGESKPALASADDIDRIRKHFGVRTILVGHTKVPTVTRLYGGKVIAVQVYPHRDETTGEAIMEAVRLDNRAWCRARIDGGRELLGTTKAEE